MAKTQTADVLLRYKVDQSSANQVRQSFNQLESELDDLRAELNGISASASSGVSGLRQRFAQGEQAVNGMQDEVEQLRRDLLALDDVTVTPTVDVRGTNGGAVGGLQTVDRIGRLGSQVGGGLGATGLGNSVNLIGDLADAASTLNPALIAASAAIAATAVLTNQLTTAYNEARAAAEQYLARQTEINLLAQQNDTAGLQARRDQLAAELQARNASAASVQTLIDEYNRLDVIVNGIGFYRPFEEIQQAQADQLLVLEQINRLTGGNAAAIYGAQDALNAFNLETQNIKTNLALVDAALAGAVTKMVEFGDKASLAIDKIGKAIKDLGNAGIQGGLASGSSLADAQAALNAQTQGARTDAYLSAITKTIQSQEALTKAQEAYNESVAASAARMDDINARLAESLAEAETERLASLKEAEQRAGEEQVKAVEQYEAEKARIQKRFDRSSFAAIANRDALAAKQAEQAFEDENATNEDRRDEAIKSVRDSLKKQNEIIAAAYKKQIDTANAAAQSAIRLETQRAQAELTVRQQAITAAQTQLVNAKQAEYLIQSNFYNTSVSQAQVWANLMQLYIGYGLSLPSGSSKMTTPITGKAAGGPVMANTPYKVGENGPELFVPAQSGRIIPNGAAFTINVVGAQTGTIKAVSRQQAMATFGKVLDQMGVA